MTSVLLPKTIVIKSFEANRSPNKYVKKLKFEFEELFRPCQQTLKDALIGRIYGNIVALNGTTVNEQARYRAMITDFIS